MFLTIIVFILTLLVLVLSHEFGHFLAAKKFGVKVLEFGFGIPPRIFGRKFGETIFSLNALPIGGFVRLFGEDETDKKILGDIRSFTAQPVLQRIVIIVAGVAMNFLLAVVLFWVVLAARGFQETIPLLAPYQFLGVNQMNNLVVLVGEVSPGSPAEAAGIRGGDRIVKVDGTKLESTKQLVGFAKSHGGEKVVLALIGPDEQTRQVEIVPRANPPEGQGPLGVSLGSVMVANLTYQTPGQKLASGFTHSYNLASYSFVVLGSFIKEAFEAKDLAPVSGQVVGPVGITNLTSAILQTEAPLIPYLNFVALLSLNLAIINIFPFPALDGGRLLFLVIEAVSRRKVKAEVERFIHAVGMAILIALIVMITLSDIRKLLP